MLRAFFFTSPGTLPRFRACHHRRFQPYPASFAILVACVWIRELFKKLDDKFWLAVPDCLMQSRSILPRAVPRRNIALVSYLSLPYHIGIVATQARQEGAFSLEDWSGAKVLEQHPATLKASPRQQTLSFQLFCKSETVLTLDGYQQLTCAKTLCQILHHAPKTKRDHRSIDSPHQLRCLERTSCAAQRSRKFHTSVEPPVDWGPGPLIADHYEQEANQALPRTNGAHDLRGNKGNPKSATETHKSACPWLRRLDKPSDQ